MLVITPHAPETWTDRSNPPVVGMRVQAYFPYGLDSRLVTEIEGDRYYFDNSYFLRWRDGLGFSY